MLVAVSVVIFLIFKKEQNINSLGDKKEITKGDTSLPNRFNVLAEKYLTTNLEHGRKLAEKALGFSKLFDYPQGEAKANLILGEYYFLNNNDEKAVDFSEKAYNLYVKINDFHSANKSKELEGRVFLKHDMFDHAYDVYKYSLEVAKELSDNELMAVSYANLGNVLKAQKKYNQAIIYYKKANKIYSKTDNKNGQALCYADLGLTYKELKNFHYATVSFEKALSLLTEEDNQKAAAYIEIGEIEISNLNMAKAMEYFEKAEEIELQHEDNFDLSLALYKQSEALLHMNKGPEALIKSKKASETALIAGNKEVERDAYNLVSAIYATNNDYKLAFEYKNKAEYVDEEITNDVLLKNFNKLQASLEFNKKLEAEKEKEAKLKAELDKQASNHYMLIGIFIPFLITSIFFISKINISTNYIRAIVFVTIILVMEFLLVVLDPYVDKYTGGIPISKLLINTVLALMMAPLQHVMERFIKKKVIESRMVEKKSPIMT